MKDLVLSHFTTFHFWKALRKEVEGGYLLDAYQTSTEQRVFVIDGHKGLLFLNVYLSGHNNFFWVKRDQSKPKTKYNTVFKSFHDEKIQEFRIFKNERCFSLLMEDKRQLFFGFFGRVNKILTIEHGERNFTVELGSKNIELEQTKELLVGEGLVEKLFPAAFKNLGYESILEQVQKPTYRVLEKANGLPAFQFFDEQTVLFKSQSLEQTLDQYVRYWFSRFSFQQLFQKLEKHLKKEQKRLQKAIEKAEIQVNNISTKLNYKEWADVLMANLHQVDSSKKVAVLFNFYDDNEIEIPLKKSLTAAENAENYYRKGKNQGKELHVLKSRIDRDFEKLLDVEEKLDALVDIEDFRSLQTIEKEWLGKSTKKVEQQSPKFQEFSFKNYLILVGRNQKNNDELTVKHAQKNDLWLHAKDLAGSHVVIRNKGSQTNYPKDVIERAAEIAAYYSKGRNQETCPVIYTSRKYIHKGKNMPAGQVRVDREDVIFVSPQKPDN